MSGGAEPTGSARLDGVPGSLSRLLIELAATPHHAVSESDSLAPGERMGRFVIRREIGRGGFGAVYEADDPELGRSVALKTLRADGRRTSLPIDTVRAEAEAIARLEHASIVTVFDVGSAPRPFLVMELLRGETLARRIARGPLPIDEALSIAEQIASALAHAHARRVLHRDLKPANVFLTESGRVKLLDFGIAHLLGRTDGSSGAGTPRYLPPERDRDERADVYAAGVMLAETLGAGAAALQRRPDGTVSVVLAPSAPRWAARLLQPAVAIDPADRPRDGAAWLEAVRAARTRRERSRARRRKARLAAALGVAGVLAVAALWRSGVTPRLGPSQRPSHSADAAIAQEVTRSVAAHQAYAEGLRCRERGLGGCGRSFGRAIAIDPTFAMAHYEIAVGTFLGPDFAGRGLPALAEALRYIERAPEADRVSIRAFAAWVDGREEEAASLYSEAAASHPNDFLAVWRAAGFFFTRDEPSRALPYQHRAVELAPVPGLGLVELVDIYSALGLREELVAVERRARDLVAEGGHPQAITALVVARASLGDRAGAIAAARAAVERARTAEARDGALADLWMTRILAGELDVEREIRLRCDYESTYQLFTLLGLQGRHREALRVLERGDRPECPRPTPQEWREFEDSLFFNASLARFSAGFADRVRARRHALVALERNPALGPHLAVYLAYAGDPSTAAEAARGLAAGSPRRLGYEAVDLWRRGEREQALALLRDLAQRTASSATPHVLPPSFLLGELAAEMGDDPAAIDSLERFGALYFYRLDFWSWAYPRSLYLLARSYARSGDVAHARERIATLLRLWKSADSDVPLLKEARALGRELGVERDGTPAIRPVTTSPSGSRI